MKRMITLCALTALLSSCAIFKTETKIGMTEVDYNRINRLLSRNYMIYSMQKDKNVYMEPGNGSLRTFYFFEQGRLVEIKTLEREPDVLIQHEKKVIIQR